MGLDIDRGHILRRPETNTTRQALSWNPQGERKAAAQETPGEGTSGRYHQDGLQLEGLEKIAQDRGRWRTVVCSLCPTQGPRT